MWLIKISFWQSSNHRNSQNLLFIVSFAGKSWQSTAGYAKSNKIIKISQSLNEKRDDDDYMTF